MWRQFCFSPDHNRGGRRSNHGNIKVLARESHSFFQLVHLDSGNRAESAENTAAQIFITEGAMREVDYKIRQANPADHDLVYALKAESVRPYVEKIWGWNEDIQRKAFDSDYAAIEQFQIIEVDGKFSGFVQCSCDTVSCHIIELHLLAGLRGKGVGSDILRSFQSACSNCRKRLLIGCFKDNDRAYRLYQRLGFRRTRQTATHYILEYFPFPAAKPNV